MIRIAIDAMGGDFAPKEQVKGAVLALQNDKDFIAVLCGDEEKIRAELALYKNTTLPAWKSCMRRK